LNESANHTEFAATTEFIGCIFSNFPKASSNGGAIYVETTSVSTISIDSCEFKNISITGYNGGGIYIVSVGRVRVESTIFYNTSGSEGGGIYVYDISSCCLIHNCDFQDSFASRAGGGMYLYSVVTTDSCSSHSSFGTVFGCLFFKCIINGAGYVFAGGLCLHSSPEKGCVRSCVFHQCSANPSSGGGGGIGFRDFSSSISDEIILYFSLFHENQAKTGKDIYIQTNRFSSSPFISSYSTNTNNNRVVQNE
jgi:hypothetical protein